MVADYRLNVVRQMRQDRLVLLALENPVRTHVVFFQHWNVGSHGDPAALDRQRKRALQDLQLSIDLAV